MEKIIEKARGRLEAKYFEDWGRAETPDEREAIYHQQKALKELQFAIINAIRSNEDE